MHVPLTTADFAYRAQTVHASRLGLVDEPRTPKATVVLWDDSTFDPDELISFCRKRLAHFKCATIVEQRDSLPRTAAGKIQKYLLRANESDTAEDRDD